MKFHFITCTSEVILEFDIYAPKVCTNVIFYNYKDVLET